MAASFTFGFDYEDVDDLHSSLNQNGSHQNSQVLVQQGPSVSIEPDLSQLEAPKLHSLHDIVRDYCHLISHCIYIASLQPANLLPYSSSPPSPLASPTAPSH